jgi:hypothetical protein
VYSRFVADPIPTTQKGQLDGLFTALGVPAGDYAAAMNAIAAFQTAANWQNDQRAIFSALGATDQASAISAIATLKTPPAAQGADNVERDTFFALLGDNVKDFATATRVVGEMKGTAANYATLLSVIGAADHNAAIIEVSNAKAARANHQALVTSLGATDHASAIAAATNIEVTVTQRVKQQAAAAGLPGPAPKGKTPAGDEKADRPVSARSRLAASINEQIAK